jgi:hypothetical protein
MENSQDFKTKVTLDDDYDKFTFKFLSGETSYFDENDNEVFLNISKEELELFCD